MYFIEGTFLEPQDIEYGFMTLGYKVRIYDQSQDRGIRPPDVRYDYGFIVTSLISVNVKTLGFGVGLRNYQSSFKRGL